MNNLLTCTIHHVAKLFVTRCASSILTLSGVFLFVANLPAADITPEQQRPVADNDSPIGRAQNRRVELGKL